MADERKIIVESPENSETPLDAIRGWVTPERFFFVRNHFDVPRIDAASWRLAVDGAVQRPFTLTLDELAEMPQRSVLATIECAGNGRSFLAPEAAGVQWGAGAIAHAEWSGVPLRLVLERAGVADVAVEIVFTAADQGLEPDHPQPMHFARSLPLDKALHADTLLATHINGEPLSPNHGFPLRLLVPGWYGVASVKWLSRIEAVRQPFAGYFQTKKYTVGRRTSSGVERVGVRRMAIKSELVRPRRGETLKVGANRLFGVAWAGEETVALVEVSTDGGETWSNAQLLGPHAAYSWTLWEYVWEASGPGDYTLRVRATSSSGRTQPSEHDPLNEGYVINFTRPIPLHVESHEPAPAVGPDVEALLYDMNAFAEANAAAPLDVNIAFSHGAGI